MRDKIWKEMQQVKFGIDYITNYLDFQKKMKQIFEISTLLFSTSGVFSWVVWKSGMYSQFALVAITIIQLLKLVESKILLNSDKIGKVSELKTLYIKYFNKLEKLWMESEKEDKDEQQVKEDFYILRDTDFINIEKLDDKLNIPNITYLKNKSETSMKKYLKNRFYN